MSSSQSKLRERTCDRRQSQRRIEQLSNWAVQPGKRHYGNCLVVIIRFIAYGGYLVIRRSVSLRFIPHIGWKAHHADREVLSFQPVHRLYGWRALFHGICFYGEWRFDEDTNLQEDTNLDDS